MCRRGEDAIWTSPPEQGIERIEARFHGNGFEPHRHDTYAIGLTLAGVQSFSYRREAWASLPGQVIVIHPDEVHDGGAGTELGLRYRMIYISPEKIAEALDANGIKGLPFVASPVLSDRQFQQDVSAALSDIRCEIGDLKRTDLVADLAACLAKHGSGKNPARSAVHETAIKRCAEYLREICHETVKVEDLAKLSGLDRFSLSRQFKQYYGTSPHRFLIMRRLENVKTLLSGGASLAASALECGFADQSHMSRHFKQTYGFSPGRWRQLIESTSSI